MLLDSLLIYVNKDERNFLRESGHTRRYYDSQRKYIKNKDEGNAKSKEAIAAIQILFVSVSQSVTPDSRPRHDTRAHTGTA